MKNFQYFLVISLLLAWNSSVFSNVPEGSAFATSISGTVYVDPIFGDTNYPTTTGIGSVTLPDGSSQQLYIYAENEDTNLVEAIATVAANGTYTLTGLTNSQDYDIILSTNILNVGDPAWSQAPIGYIFSADQDDDGTINQKTGDPNGDVDTNSDSFSGNLGNINFWIASQTYDVSGRVVEDNTDDNTVNGTGNGQPDGQTLYVYLANDATNIVFHKSTVNTNGTYTITGGANGFYDVIITTQNLNIGDGQPTNLPYPLIGNWAYVGDLDDDGSFSNSAAVGNVGLARLNNNIPNVNFGIRNGLTISGQVFEDPDRATNGANGTGIGAPKGQQLYVYLVDDNLPSPSLAAYATTVNGDGTYSISDIAPGDYDVYLTTEVVSIGGQVPNPPDVFLLGGCIITVEDEQGIVNNDDTVDGRIDYNNLLYENAANLNYGITQVNYISGTVTQDTDVISDSIGNVPPTEGAYLVYLLDLVGNNVFDPVNNLPIYGTTRADGTYFLNDVPAGDYEVHIFDNVGYDAVADTDSVNDGADDTDTNSSTTDKFIPVSIVSNENDTGNDFVIRAQKSICLEWEEQGLTGGGSFPNNSIYSAGGIDVAVNWSVVDANGSLSPATTSTDFVQYNTSQQGGHSGYIGLSMNNAENNQADYVEVVLNFNGTFTNLEFDVLDVDIDSEGNNDFVDAVEIFYNGTNNIRSTSFYTVSGISVYEYTGGGITGLKGKLPESNPEEASGNIAIDFGNTPITDVTIRYYSAPDATADPDNQFIGISDFCWENDYDISGQVFKDSDELTDNQVDGTGIGAPNGEQIYAYLVDDDSDIIIAVDAVASDGTFSFPNQCTGADYDVVISTEVLSIGDPQPDPNIYPTNWYMTGEYDPESGSIDTSPGGNVDLNPLTADVDSVFFGLNVNFQSGLNLVTCNNNGTSADALDDYITFNLDPTQIGLGSTYSVSVDNGGTVTLGGSGAANNISYGSSTAFRLQDGSADGATTYTITITDDTDNTCSVDISFMVASCSTNPCVSPGNTSVISGAVWEDWNYDGAMNETTIKGLEGIRIYIYNDCNAVVDSTQTNANGQYSFSSLTASTTYRIEFAIPD